MSVVRKSTPGHVEADRLGGAHGHGAVVGVHDVGDVARPCRRWRGCPVERRYTTSPSGGHALLVVALLLQEPQRLVVELEPRQHLLVPDAAARILRSTSSTSSAIVCSPSPTTWPGTRLATAIERAVHHEHAVVEPGDEALHDDGALVLARLLERDAHLVIVLEADRDAAAVVGVERLHDDRVADALRGAHRLLLAVRPSPGAAPAGPGRRGCGSSPPCRRRSPPRCGASRS